MSFEEQLSSLGWSKYYECGACKGGKRRYYNHPNRKGYDIRYNTKIMMFNIYLNNQRIAGPFNGYMVTEKINAHVS